MSGKALWSLLDVPTMVSMRCFSLFIERGLRKLLHTVGRVRQLAGGGAGGLCWEMIAKCTGFSVCHTMQSAAFQCPWCTALFPIQFLAPSNKLLNYSHTSTPCCSIKIIKKRCNVLHLDSLLSEAKQMSREEDYQSKAKVRGENENKNFKINHLWGSQWTTD